MATTDPVRTVDVVARTRFNARCRGRTCGQTITWFQTWPKRRWIPFNADPVALRTRGNPIRGEDSLEEIDAADVHWATCPDD